MNYIEKIISKLIQKHGTNDPFEIASRKNIIVLFEDLGSTLGYFNSYKRMQMIHINNALSEYLKRFVCAHELGHAILHPDINTPFMRKNTFYSVDRVEKEANTFAVNLLVHNVTIVEGETKERFCMRNELPVEMVGYL